MSTIELSEKSFFDSKIGPLDLPISEYSFTNLYCFQEAHQFTYDPMKELFYGIAPDGFRYVTPLYIPKNPAALSHYPIPEEWLHFYPENLFSRTFLEEESDYLYLREKLATLPGRKLASKRNLLYQTERDHELSALSFMEGGDSAIDQAKEILRRMAPDKLNDQAACLKALRHFQALALEGFVVSDMDQPVGFIIGERLTKSVYLIHFAKGFDSVRGIYIWMYTHLAKSLSPDVIWINLEQDLGLPSLRKAKQELIPDRLLVKWRLTPKTERKKIL